MPGNIAMATKRVMIAAESVRMTKSFSGGQAGDEPADEVGQRERGDDVNGLHIPRYRKEMVANIARWS